MTVFRILSHKPYLRLSDGSKINLQKRPAEKQFLKFDWRKGVKFFEGSVAIKMIPASEKIRRELFNNKKIFSLKSKTGNELLIQLISGDLKLLSIEDDGIIFPKQVNSISEDDSLVLYENDEWIIDDVDSVGILDVEESISLGNLSNYLFSIEKNEGIILNDFLIC